MNIVYGDLIINVIMKTRRMNPRTALRVLTLIIAGLFTSQVLTAQQWYSSDWLYRMPVTVPNSGTTHLSSFQVQIILTGGTGGNFDFSKAKSDGSDIRVTSDNGVTLIPFWLETWDANDEDPRSDTVWVKVPNIPAEGTTVYIYYGNGNVTITDPDYVPYYPYEEFEPSVPVEMPPSGPYTKHPDNPIIPIGRPAAGATSLLAENIVYDDVTGHYWMVLSNQTSGTNVSLVYSDDPTNPDAWYWPQVGEPATPAPPVIPNAIAPHIIKHNGRWYIFYGDRSVSPPYPISVRSSESIAGPYEPDTRQVVLESTEPWELRRVDEPYVFQRNDGKWILMYMANTDGGNNEQVGYAVADNLLGPYTKFNSDDPEKPDGLCIPLGFGGTYDAGTVADPWVIEHKGVYYIGYTVSPTTGGWSTALATTTDWETFTPRGIILDKGTEGNSFRGAVTRIGDQYVFPYTGDSFDMRIATQPVFRQYPSPVDNPDAVFDFYDGFDGEALDDGKWTLREEDDADQIVVGDGSVTLTSASTSNYVRIDGNSTFGVNYIGETRARHPNPPASNMIAEYGLAQSVTNFDMRITDNFTAIGRWQRYVLTDSASFGPPTDTEWHIYRIYRESTGTAGYMVDEASAIVTSGVPTANLRPFLMSFGTNNQFIIDWSRIRKWAGAEPFASAGSEESLTTHWVGTISNDWNVSGNWSPGVPAEWNLINITGASNNPILDGSLMIGPTAGLTVDATGALTVMGDMTNNGLLTISSTLASSGSLIVSGTATGNITYNRQLKPGSDATSDWHLAAAPVATNSDANTGKVNTVYEWSETANTWSATDITSALPGHGYNIRQEEASDGVISFTGPIVNSDLTVAASSPYADAIAPDDSYFDRTYVAGRSLENLGGRGWNLLGNPYPSAINASAFINANYNATPSLSQFDPNYLALYLFDGTARRYYYVANSTGWPSGTDLSATHIQAGQGFFVLAMNDNSEFTFTRAMQEHSTATAMLKSGETDDRWPGLQLKVAHTAGEVITTVVYSNEMTTGVDPGYDVGLFKSGQDVELYTILPAGDNGINYTRQALPLSVADTIVVPVGVDTEDDGEVVFSAATVPAGTNKFWLEDRTAGTFTDLSSATYTVTLPAKSYGTGRFYIIASTNTPTGVDLPEVEAGLRIWSSFGKIIIKGSVTDGSVCELFDIQGNRILETRLTDGDLNTVSLPAGMVGVCLVRVTDGVKVTSKKVVVL
jgi:hypothetical protein